MQVGCYFAILLYRPLGQLTKAQRLGNDIPHQSELLAHVVTSQSVLYLYII